MDLKLKNVFEKFPSDQSGADRSPGEIFETLLKTDRFKLERIVSSGHTTPQGKWYDQDWHEWVIVLQGSAELRFQDEEKAQTMIPGDYVNIPARCRHRVEWTDPNIKTIWLAFHYMPDMPNMQTHDAAR